MKSIDNIEHQIKTGNQKFIESDLQPFLRISSNTLNKEGILRSPIFQAFAKKLKSIKVISIP
jgi:hypothetical protein